MGGRTTTEWAQGGARGGGNGRDAGCGTSGSGNTTNRCNRYVLSTAK